MFTSSRVEEVLARCAAFMADKQDAWSIDRPSGLFLHQVVLSRHAQILLEVGTSYGHSALYLADAAAHTGGRLYTIEQNPAKVPIARGFLDDAGLSPHATVLQGSAPASFTQVPDPIDFLFIDATKQQQNEYLDALLPRLAKRAVIVTDNVGDQPHNMADYLKRLRTDPRFASAFVNVGHGMEWTVVL